MIDKQGILDALKERDQIRQEEHLAQVGRAIDFVLENLVGQEYRDGITGNVVMYKGVKCMITRHDFRYRPEIDLRPLSSHDKIAECRGMMKTLQFNTPPGKSE